VSCLSLTATPTHPHPWCATRLQGTPRNGGRSAAEACSRAAARRTSAAEASLRASDSRKLTAALSTLLTRRACSRYASVTSRDVYCPNLSFRAIVTADSPSAGCSLGERNAVRPFSRSRWTRGGLRSSRKRRFKQRWYHKPLIARRKPPTSTVSTMATLKTAASLANASRRMTEAEC
jgi:hypothetical protein